jgi:long-subunit acyl-CoA synthetase (AMP-forming)
MTTPTVAVCCPTREPSTLPSTCSTATPAPGQGRLHRRPGQLTYGELADRVRRVAAGLRALGLRARNACCC